jgi:hypothetical protein
MSNLHGQDSLEVYYIFLKKDTTTEISTIIKDSLLPENTPLPEKMPYYKVANKGDKDFIRHTNLYKIPLLHLQNQVLLKTKYKQNLFWDSLDNEKFRQNTLVECLIEGVQSGKILAAMPQDLSLRYSYTQLCKEIRKIENTEQQDSVEKMDMTEFGIENTQTLREELRSNNWENLNEVMYLIGEEGSAQSQAFFRPRYLCLVWHNPNLVLKPHLTMVIPYIFLEKYLQQIYIVDKRNENTSLSVHDYFVGKMFFGDKVKL